MRRVLPGLLVSLLIVGAGCGDDGGPSGDTSPLAERVRKVAKATEKAGTAQIFVELLVEAKAKGKEPKKVTVPGQGVWDFVNDRGRQSRQIGTATSEVIVVGGAEYTKSPTAPNPAKPWTKVAAKGTPRLGTTDPEQALILLLGAKDVREAGTAEVRGHGTVRYKFSIDVSDALSRLPEGERQAYERSLESIKGDELPAELWIDEGGRMRRLRYSILAEAKGASSKVVTTMELFDFGTTVDVVAPPANEVE